jgi:hypothetical protein
MANAKQTLDIPPISFLTKARHFFAAAERVFSPPDYLLSGPLYFLYFHALELTFKAFLRSHNVPTGDLRHKQGHDLIALYRECRHYGFMIGPNDHTDVENVVNMLARANEDQGLRYFNPNASSFPSFSWTPRSCPESY